VTSLHFGIKYSFLNHADLALNNFKAEVVFST